MGSVHRNIRAEVGYFAPLLPLKNIESEKAPLIEIPSVTVKFEARRQVSDVRFLLENVFLVTL